MSFSTLPNELVYHISTFLSVNSRSSLALTSKGYRFLGTIRDARDAVNKELRHSNIEIINDGKSIYARDGRTVEYDHQKSGSVISISKSTHGKTVTTALVMMGQYDISDDIPVNTRDYHIMISIGNPYDSASYPIHPIFTSMEGFITHGSTVSGNIPNIIGSRNVRAYLNKIS
jgi:hypothetical protein